MALKTEAAYLEAMAVTQLAGLQLLAEAKEAGVTLNWPPPPVLAPVEGKTYCHNSAARALSDAKALRLYANDIMRQAPSHLRDRAGALLRRL